MIRRLAALLGALALLLVIAPTAAAVTFTVDTAAQGMTEDGGCDPAAPNDCTLDDAAYLVNSGFIPGPFTIAFDVGGGGAQTLNRTTSVPAFSQEVQIDGTTQPGYAGKPLIQIVGPDDPTSGKRDGLALQGASSSVSGLSLSGWRGDAIGIYGNSSARGNWLGLDATGSGPSAKPNGRGIVVGTDYGQSFDATVAGNVVGNSFVEGVLLSGDGSLEGNRIGTDVSGTTSIPNDIGVVTADRARIGGPGAGQGNLISGNQGDGIEIDAGTPTIVGNSIGLAADGDTALPNGGSGVYVAAAEPELRIAQNVISGNTGNGVALSNDLTGGTLSGNSIGFSASGGTRGNGGNGVDVQSAGTSVLSNRIGGNGRLGIDLRPISDPPGVITVNDGGTADDADTGPNALTNFPVISEASATAGMTRAVVTLDALPDTEYRVELFRSTACDPSGYGEGGELLGADELITTGADGTAQAVLTRAASLAATDVVTATATPTDANDGGTSEFGPCVDPVDVAQTPLTTSDGGATSGGGATSDAGAMPAARTAEQPPTQAPPARTDTVRVQVAGGVVVVTLPDGRVVPADSLTEIPVGTRIDATRGAIRLVHGRDEMTFSQGAFVVTRDPDGRVNLVLQGEIGPCPKGRASAAAEKKKRRLFGDGHGDFRVSGKHSATGVRGTQFLVEDSCEGTRTTVTRGVVEVRDYALGLEVVVRAGGSYLARRLPLPVRRKTVNLIPLKASGATIRLPGGRTVALTAFRRVPVGTTVDATSTGVRVVSAGIDVTQHATFTQGALRIAGQEGSVLDLALADRPVLRGARVAANAGKRLWADGDGQFRVSGKASATTGRGAKWLVEDRPKGTLTKVVRGVATVEDFRLRTSVTVSAGRRHLART